MGLVVGVLLVAAVLFFVLRKDDSSKLKGEDVVTVSWFDGMIPGTNYELQIDRPTGNFRLEIQPGCSTVECMNGTYYPEGTVSSGTFGSEELGKLLAALEKIDFENSEEFSNQANWFAAARAYTIKDETYTSCVKDGEKSLFWELCVLYDSDGDNLVTEKEYADKLIEEIL